MGPVKRSICKYIGITENVNLQGYGRDFCQICEIIDANFVGKVARPRCGLIRLF